MPYRELTVLPEELEQMLESFAQSLGTDRRELAVCQLPPLSKGPALVPPRETRLDEIPLSAFVKHPELLSACADVDLKATQEDLRRLRVGSDLERSQPEQPVNDVALLNTVYQPERENILERDPVDQR